MKIFEIFAFSWLFYLTFWSASDFIWLQVREYLPRCSPHADVRLLCGDESWQQQPAYFSIDPPAQAPTKYGRSFARMSISGILIAFYRGIYCFLFNFQFFELRDFAPQVDVMKIIWPSGDYRIRYWITTKKDEFLCSCRIFMTMTTSDKHNFG